MAERGRPKKDNKMEKIVGIRLVDSDLQKLDAISRMIGTNGDRSKTLRKLLDGSYEFVSKIQGGK